MARKGLPRKYAKMGFKKGWAAYKRTKRAPVRKRTTTKRRSPTMAKGRGKRIYRKARGGGGSFKPIIDGMLAGAAGGLASNYVGEYGHPVAALGIGYFRNNNVLKTEGARGLGAMLVNQFMGGGGNGKGGGFN